MTTPISGSISFGNINTEIGVGATNALGMDWVRSNTKDSIKDLDSTHNRAYYQRNVDGNCNNGNCTDNPDATGGGRYNCINCKITGTINCSNCDAKPWLQGNCNCACTYNCDQGTIFTNCNCLCLCACAWSDDRLKSKDKKISGPLDIINNLNGFYYTGNSLSEDLGLDPKRDIGLSAQEIEQHLPEALGDPIGEYKTVRYERLVPLLVEAIKELNEKLNNVKNKDS